MPLLSATDWPLVRAALDTSLDEEGLPDAIIEMDIYHAAGERDVLAIHADAEAETGDDLQRMKNAAVYFVAARLAPAIPRITSASSDAVEYRRNFVEWRELAEELRQMAVDEIYAVTQPSEDAPSRPTMFAVASGRRGA